MKASDMLLHAAELVGGQRAEDYGDKTENHKRIAALWTYWMVESRKNPNYDSPEINAYDAAMMMLLVKVARLMHSPGHQDSHVDIAGYASIMEEIANKEPTS
jgi:hypothetical protein